MSSQMHMRRNSITLPDRYSEILVELSGCGCVKITSWQIKKSAYAWGEDYNVSVLSIPSDQKDALLLELLSEKIADPTGFKKWCLTTNILVRSVREEQQQLSA